MKYKVIFLDCKHVRRFGPRTTHLKRAVFRHFVILTKYSILNCPIISPITRDLKNFNEVVCKYFVCKLVNLLQFPLADK